MVGTDKSTQLWRHPHIQTSFSVPLPCVAYPAGSNLVAQIDKRFILLKLDKLPRGHLVVEV